MKVLVSGRTWILIFVLMISSCNTLQTFTGEYRTSPRAKYIRNLEKSQLASSPMVKAWIDAGNVTGNDSILITLPFNETGFFASSELQARFYRFDAQDGQVLTLNTIIKSKENAKLFIDIFKLEDGFWKEEKRADTSLTVTHEFRENAPCLIRIQPELLVNMYYSVSLSVTPVLLNPVKGASNKSIGSFWGDARDGGKRKHEGVDIFAAKGTLVIAPTDGIVTSVGVNSLGGKVVWMSDTKRRHSYYFAHLDSQIATRGMKVRQGDALGTVGNTGNARNTPSHLHFGIYQKNAKDPVSFIQTMEQFVNNLMPDTLFQSIVFRTNQKTSKIYAGPAKKNFVKDELQRDTWVKVIGQSKDWYRVVTADATEGFIEKKVVVPALKGVVHKVKTPVPFLTEPSEDAIPMGAIEGRVETLANSGKFKYIRTEQGATGWISE